MADGVIYLDVDDEITSAAARIRDIPGGRVAVVLPHGSRVATSRINLRLLARDAGSHGKRLSIVAADAATRALAASAGLPTFASVGEFAEAGDPDKDVAPPVDPQPGETARVPVPPPGRKAKAVPPAETPRQATLDEMEAAELAAAAAALERERRPSPVAERVQPEPPRRAPESRTVTTAGGIRGRVPIALVAGVVALVVIVLAVSTYLFLPSATVLVTPQAEPVPPVTMSIVADPAATAPDPVAGVVPAETVSVDVTASDTFPATGVRAETKKATAIVRFLNKDFTSSNTIPAGSVVATQNGVRFKTDSRIVVPRANIVGLQVFPKTATVTVTAVKGGTEGNVEPNTIVVIPKGENPESLLVNNPDEATGGERTEFPVVTQKDVDAALASLGPALDTAFQARLADPTIASPGATVFRETGVLGPSTPSVDPTSLVKQEVATFDLGLSATGTATAVDEAPVTDIASARLTSTIDGDHTLVDGSIKVDVDPAIVTGGLVTFPATATARQVPILDAAALRARILGMTVAQARAELEEYGDVQISTWPDWVSTIPTIESRVEVVLDDAVTVETGAPSATP